MLQIKINRIWHGASGTFGTIHCNGVPFALTAELSWLHNKKNVSCIPSGNYTCKRVNSPKFGLTYEIVGVENRTNIVFHKGNIPLEDSEGCILIGEEFGHLNGQMAVLSSARGFGEFMELTKGVELFNLTIENHWSF